MLKSLKKKHMDNLNIPQVSRVYLDIELDEPQEIDRTSTTPMQHAGILETDPTFDDWMDKLAEIRRSANEINDDKL
jgi:hypothetical protein